MIFLNVESKKKWDKWARKREILTSRAKLPFSPGWCTIRDKKTPFSHGWYHHPGLKDENSPSADPAWNATFVTGC
jgi:hypothetical protein